MFKANHIYMLLSLLTYGLIILMNISSLGMLESYLIMLKQGWLVIPWLFILIVYTTKNKDFYEQAMISIRFENKSKRFTYEIFQLLKFVTIFLCFRHMPLLLFITMNISILKLELLNFITESICSYLLVLFIDIFMSGSKDISIKIIVALLLTSAYFLWMSDGNYALYSLMYPFSFMEDPFSFLIIIEGLILALFLIAAMKYLKLFVFWHYLLNSTIIFLAVASLAIAYLSKNNDFASLGNCWENLYDSICQNQQFSLIVFIMFIFPNILILLNFQRQEAIIKKVNNYISVRFQNNREYHHNILINNILLVMGTYSIFILLTSLIFLKFHHCVSFIFTQDSICQILSTFHLMITAVFFESQILKNVKEAQIISDIVFVIICSLLFLRRLFSLPKILYVLTLIINTIFFLMYICYEATSSGG